MATKNKRKATRARKLSKSRHTSAEQQAIWVGIDSVVRNIKKIQRRISKHREPVSQLELHELKRLGCEYTKLIKRLPADNNN